MSMSVPKVGVTSASSSVSFGNRNIAQTLRRFAPAPDSPGGKVAISILNGLVDKVKAKPEAERGIMDYIILIGDKLLRIDPKMYAS